MSNFIDKFSLAGKKAIVTGGAKGLCNGMAQALHDAGAEVVLLDILDMVEDSAGEMAKKGPMVHGPKAALGILSGLSADELRFAVLADDVKTISKAPGIGKKTAQKLILELKDKLDLQEAFQLKSQHVQEADSDLADLSDMRKEAVEALAALGYSGADALRAVKKVELTADMNVEALLKAALKNMF